MRNKKIKDGWLLWLLLLLVAVIVLVGMMAIAKPLPLIALPIIVVGAIVILAWIFCSSQQTLIKKALFQNVLDASLSTSHLIALLVSFGVQFHSRSLAPPPNSSADLKLISKLLTENDVPLLYAGADRFKNT